MNIFTKANILSSAGHFDSCGPKMCEVNIKEGLGGIYHAKAEHESCKIFKTLMDNSCTFDCKYCQNTCKKNKASFEPQELAKLFNHLHKTLDVNGLFISSGVAVNPDHATSKMIEAVKMVRKEYNFKGYVHFKVLPGVSKYLIEEASLYANRMSINVEAPNKSVLSEYSTCKDFKNDILKRQSWIKDIGLKSGQSTQVVLSRLSSDKDILKLMHYEYDYLKLKRVYYSAFSPVSGTALENEPAEPKVRESRLYNVDFLVRTYGYKYKEFLRIMDSDMLPRSDPKLELAKIAFDRPVDINESSYEELIRIPGIGPKTAKIILNKTRLEKISSFSQLDSLGVHIDRAKPFIEINGMRQANLGEFMG